MKVKSIEFCLDNTLKELDKSWKGPEDKTPIEAERLLRDWGYPNRHTYYMSIVDKLITDGYAKLLEKDDKSKSEIDWYQRRTIITIDGHYFVRSWRSYRINWYLNWIPDLVKFIIPVIISIMALLIANNKNSVSQDTQQELIDLQQSMQQQLGKFPAIYDSLRLLRKDMEDGLQQISNHNILTRVNKKASYSKQEAN